MPRSRGGGGGPARAPPRPQAPPPRPAAPAQQRPMSTAPAAQQARPGQAQAQQSQSPGLFGQMASTAAGVAVGSSIGHAIGGFFGGGSSAAQQQEYQQPVDNYSQPGTMYDTDAQNQSYEAQGPCAADIKSFTTCMNQNNGDMNVCGWYLDQLRACQAAAKQY